MVCPPAELKNRKSGREKPLEMETLRSVFFFVHHFITPHMPFGKERDRSFKVSLTKLKFGKENMYARNKASLFN